MSDPCMQGERLATLENQYNSMTDTLSRLETKLDAIAISLAKVAVLETKHDNQNGALERAFTAINKLEATQSGHNKFIWMTTGGAIVLSVMWTMFGGWLMSQMADTRNAVAEMRSHIASDKLTSVDDLPKPREAKP